MAEGKTHHKKVGRPKSTSTHKKSSSHKKVGRPSGKTASTRKSTTAHRKPATASTLKEKTVVQLKRMAKTKGVKQSHHGEPLRKSSLIRAIVKSAH